MGDRTPDGRYASFDYCYNYFQSFRESGKVIDIAAPEHMMNSCLHLGFYLASWGMFRASSVLPRRSLKQFESVVELIAHTPADLWEIDAHCYSTAVCRLLIDTASEIKAALHYPHGVRPPTITLATKIMLGVFGNVPAFDSRVMDGLRLVGLTRTFGVRALRDISRFYDDHHDEIEHHRNATFDFATGKLSQRRYTRAKVIDEVFYIEGKPRADTP
jgi:hypothetical protein